MRAYSRASRTVWPRPRGGHAEGAGPRAGQPSICASHSAIASRVQPTRRPPGRTTRPPPPGPVAVPRPVPCRPPNGNSFDRRHAAPEDAVRESVGLVAGGQQAGQLVGGDVADDGDVGAGRSVGRPLRQRRQQSPSHAWRMTRTACSRRAPAPVAPRRIRSRRSAVACPRRRGRRWRS